MEYVILIIVICAFVLIITIKGIMDHKKEHKIFIEKIKNSFGTFSEFEITEVKMNKIKKYFLEHKDERWNLDDITWNDCDMDAIFQQMNTTFSSAGEEYLYYMLRTPSFKEEKLQEVECLVSFFQENEEKRILLQDIFHQLGTTGKYSLYDYLNYLDNLGNRSNRANIMALVFMVCSVGLIPINVSIGVFTFILVTIYNIITYFKDKNEIKPYLTSFSYILRLIESSNKLSKVAPEEFAKYKEKLMESCKELRAFSKHSFITMSMGEASSSPLDILIDYFRMMLHFDLIKFNRMLKVIREKKDAVDSLVGTMGYIESTIVIANYRKALGVYSKPEFGEGVSFAGMYHPLIQDPISNDFDSENCVLLTGSNASGKSTFLKMVAINCILAQTIHTCSAEKANLRLQYIYSSMKLEDSIEKKESYYMAEIRAIKRILDATIKEEIQVICFVDEVLRGTNTVERIAASTQILKSLSQNGVFCFAATHDIELTNLLENEYENYHFTEEIQQQDIFFSYKILKGPAITRNAILLLEKMGYPKELVDDAKKRATSFMETGVWEDNI